jgi:uncharacterized membrane protein
MTWYTFFKSIHVVTAVVWIGGATMIQAYALRILATDDGKRQADFSKDSEVVGMRLFIPASLILVLAGIAMMVNADLSWGQNWVVFGLISFALSFALGAGFLGPEGGRIAELIEQEGPDSPVVKARIRRILTFSRCELVVMLTVIWAMVVKPTGQSGWFWAGLAVMVLATVLVIVSYRRGGQAVALPASD